MPDAAIGLVIQYALTFFQKVEARGSISPDPDDSLVFKMKVKDWKPSFGAKWNAQF